MGGAGDKFQPEGNVAMALICAQCKEPAAQDHECKVVITSKKETQNGKESNSDKE